MKNYEIDVAVLLIFFTRVDKTREVFETIKKARPSKLYLYQDGPRNENDMPNIVECRKIVKDIDWECELHTFFQEANVGCDPSEFIAQKWMFKTEDMGIILEDDDVPSQSFFLFCKELLERYKDNPKINMICGMNNLDYSKGIKSSYFFSRTGSIWGWASWRRVLDSWDEKYSWLDDKDKIKEMRKHFPKHFSFKRYLKTAKAHRLSGRAHYESIAGASRCLYDRLNIVPSVNLIKNIGISTESTHSTDDIRILSRRSQRYLSKELHEIDFPLIHPESIQNTIEYERLMSPSFFERLMSPIGRFFRILRYKGLSYFFKKRKHKQINK